MNTCIVNTDVVFVSLMWGGWSFDFEVKISVELKLDYGFYVYLDLT